MNLVLHFCLITSHPYLGQRAADARVPADQKLVHLRTPTNRTRHSIGRDASAQLPSFYCIHRSGSESRVH